LTPAIAFTSVAVFDELRYALNALPETFINALQGFVSCRRIEKYLAFAEVDLVQATEPSDIITKDATFTFARDDSDAKNPLTLANLNLCFPQGELSLICGRLGSGKSLLLLGLLGEADLVSGTVICPRSSPDLMDGFPDTVTDWILPSMLGYVPQQAWLQNASIRDNIIFSSPWNEERYLQVLEACSLIADLKIMEDGDQTWVIL
jgi:ABC-type multidrug transport system fused ATPase/permease subunit